MLFKAMVSGSRMVVRRASQTVGMGDLKSQVSAVGRVLNDPNQPLHKRMRAMFTLRNIGGEEAIDELIKCLSDPSVLLAHDVAYALGQMRDPRAIPVLTKVLDDKSIDPVTRHEAGEALGAIGKPEVLEALRRNLHDPETPVAETCELAIERVNWLTALDVPNEPSVFGTVDPAPPEESTDNVGDLTATLLDQNHTLFNRYKALFALRNMNTKESVLGLSKGLQVGSPLFRHEVAYVLGQTQNPAAVPDLTSSLLDDTQHEMVRHESAEALGSIGTPECSEILKRHLNDPRAIVRESCIVALDMAAYEQSGEFQSLENTVQLLTAVSGVFQKSLSGVKTELLREDLSGVLVIGLCRHEGKNALSREMVESLEQILEAVKYDQHLRTVVIRSEVPKVFCAGADLKERLSMSETEVRIFVSRLRSLMKKVEETPVPVIAAINGAALGGGLEMALACDIRVATEESKIGLVETKLAIIPGAGGTQRLSRIIGPARAKELIFTSRVLSGREAESFGIVNHCVPNMAEDSAFTKALEIAKAILPNGPLGVRMAKLAVDRGTELDMASGCLIEELCYSRVVSTKDRIEGLKAFQEKRKPKYIGE